ncbi:MAG TPA: hypothetical protein VNZ44_14115, partial [Pyrinomonadaceae bacterium]|nr:hypothetical protein [Pyrinomonadaceae bacterium]
MKHTHASRLRGSLLPFLVIAVTLAFGGFAAFKNFYPAAASAQRARPRNNLWNLVRGYVAANVGGGLQREPLTAVVRGASKDVYLPGVDVFLQDEGSRRQSDSSQTDLSGRFT